MTVSKVIFNSSFFFPALFLHWDSSVIAGIRVVADNNSEHNPVSALHSLAGSLDPAAPVRLCYRERALAGFTCSWRDRLVPISDAQEHLG